MEYFDRKAVSVSFVNYLARIEYQNTKIYSIFRNFGGPLTYTYCLFDYISKLMFTVI